MTRHYTQRLVPATVRQVLEKTTCDLCGSEIKGPPGNYDVEEVTVSMKIGNCYPDSNYGEKIAPDICRTCFEGKLLPWLKEQGCANLEPIEYDY